MRSLAAAWLTAGWMLLKQLWEPAGLTQRVPATAVWQMATNTTAEQRISIRLNRVGCMDTLLKYSNDSEVCEPGTQRRSRVRDDSVGSLAGTRRITLAGLAHRLAVKPRTKAERFFMDNLWEQNRTGAEVKVSES